MIVYARYNCSNNSTRAICVSVKRDSDQRLSARDLKSSAKPLGPPMTNATSLIRFFPAPHLRGQLLGRPLRAVRVQQHRQRAGTESV